MNSTDVLDQSVLNGPSFDPDYTAPWFFKQFSPLRSHETTSFLMAMAALSDGYDMRFFRSQREARFQWHRALSFDPEEKDAIRIRAKLEKGLDAVLAEEGAKPLTDTADGN